jgi:NitT/TauT family transport system ATP-binding protein
MSSESAISIRNVGKTYGSGARQTIALAPIDLDVAVGEFVAIVGPSGCGKSTLLRLTAGLIPRTGGDLRVFGRAVNGPVTDLGIVFQQPILLEWRNVLDNVLFQIDMRGLDRAQYRPRALALLEAVGLADFADRRPYELSGGMKQRASIARSLVHEPPLLMMDEPFGALDALTREQMRIDLERLWMDTKKTVVFITHSIDEAVLLADRVVVMSPRPGRIEQIMPIDIERPRGLSARKDPRFLQAVDAITEIFLERGVLKRRAA